MLEPAEACAMLKCEWLTLRILLHDGALPGLKISKVWVIPRRAFIEAINTMSMDAAMARRAALGDGFGDRYPYAHTHAEVLDSTQLLSPAPPATPRRTSEQVKAQAAWRPRRGKT